MVKVNEEVKGVIVELNRVQVVRDGRDDARAAEDDDVDRVRSEVGNGLTFYDVTKKHCCHIRSQGLSN